MRIKLSRYRSYRRIVSSAAQANDTLKWHSRVKVMFSHEIHSKLISLYLYFISNRRLVGSRISTPLFLSILNCWNICRNLNAWTGHPPFNSKNTLVVAFIHAFINNPFLDTAAFIHSVLTHDNVWTYLFDLMYFHSWFQWWGGGAAVKNLLRKGKS